MKRVAALDMAQAPQSLIAKETGLSRFAVARLMKSVEYQQVLERLSDHAILPAIALAREGLGKLIQECLRVLEAKLKDNSLEAVKIVFNGLGVNDPDEKKQGDTSIQIVMPQGIEAINIPSQVNDDAN